MPLPIKTRAEYVGDLRSNIRADIPTLDPSTERRSFIGGFVTAVGSLMTDFYKAMKRYADREPFPQSATGAFLFKGWWRDVTKLGQLGASPAHGYVVVTGTAGTTVDAGAEFLGSSGVTFKALFSATVAYQGQFLASLTYDIVTGLCIAQTNANRHYLGTGMFVTVAGASPSAYNGTFKITVTDDDEFTYEPLSVPGATPATGSIEVTSTYAALEVEATDTGQKTNVSPGTTIAFASVPSGADTEAIVTFGGLSGGTDVEAPDSYRARVLEALGTDFGMFSESEIKIVAKQVPGVTRVFVRSAEVYPPPPGYPMEGQTKIAFLRDNDADPLPSAQEVLDVRNRILSLELPTNTAEEDIIVMSPPPYKVDFAFNSITPDTPGMRRAIIAALGQFFREEAEWGGTITELDYECVIKAAYDLESRVRLKSFSLASPSADIIAGTTASYDYDDYPILGNVTFG